MANPTSNKPITAVFDATLGLGSATKCLIPFTEGAGLPQEYVNSKLPTVILGAYVGTGISAGLGTGTAPAWDPAGFPHSPGGGDPTLKFEHGNRGLMFPAASPNWASSTQKSIFAVFKHRYQNMTPSGVGGIARFLYYGSNPNTGLDLAISNAGVVTLQLNRNFGTVSLGVTLTAGVWYGLLLTMDDNASPRQRIVRLYNYEDQAEVTAAGGTVVTDGTTLINASAGDTKITINPCDTNPLGAIGFLGEIYAVSTLAGLPSDADFAALYADPTGAARGTYVPSGSLAAGTLGAGEITDTTATLTWTRATGTGTGGSGSPTYQLHRSTDASFTPGAGTAVSGATGLTHADIGLAANSVYHYKVVATDGSSTVTYPAGAPITVGTRKGPAINLVCPGDSITESQNAVPTLSGYINALGYACNWVNRGKSGSMIPASWSPGIGPAVVTLAIAGGTPSSGKFNIAATVNGGGAANSGNVDWNASASGAQSLLEATSNIGSGNVVVEGGPLPGTPLTITFQGSRSTDNISLALQSSSSTLNNSATTVFTQAQQGYPKGTLWDAFIAECLLLPAIDVVSFQIGTNDAFAAQSVSASQHTTNLTQWCQAVREALLSTFPGLKIVLHAPPYRTSSLTAANAEILRGYQDSIRATALAVPGVHVGDTQNYRLFADNPGLLADGTHPTTFGYGLAELNHAKAILDVVDPASLASPADVRNGVDRGDGTEGTLVVPAAGDVIAGTTFDGGTSGTFAVPAETDVVTGVQYGAAGTEFTGTHTDSGEATAEAIVAALYDSVLVNTTTFREAVSTIAAKAAGDLTEPSDHSTTSISDINDPDTVRITSVNTSTTRTVTVH